MRKQLGFMLLPLMVAVMAAPSAKALSCPIFTCSPTVPHSFGVGFGATLFTPSLHLTVRPGPGGIEHVFVSVNGCTVMSSVGIADVMPYTSQLPVGLFHVTADLSYARLDYAEIPNCPGGLGSSFITATWMKNGSIQRSTIHPFGLRRSANAAYGYLRSPGCCTDTADAWVGFGVWCGDPWTTSSCVSPHGSSLG